MALNLSAPIIATGAGVTASAAAVSSVAIVNQMSLNNPGTTLLQDKQLYRVSNSDFNYEDIFDFKTNFDTHGVNKDDTDKPLLSFVKGGCLRGFFPDVQLERPVKEAAEKADLNSSIVPEGFTFEGETSLLGCKLMKFSKAQNNAGFGYMTETTLQSRKFGLAIYSALTNLKNKETTDAEYWLLFLKKSSGKWTVSDSYRWTKSMKEQVKSGSPSTYKQQSFNEKRDHNSNLWWTWSSTNTTETAKFFDSGQDTTKLWGSNNDFYAGLWFTDNKGGTKDDMFYDGSNGGWALRDRFDDTPNNPETKNKFLQRIKLEQKGVWASIDGHCNSLHAGRERESDIFEGERNICFSRKTKKESGKRNTK